MEQPGFCLPGCVIRSTAVAIETYGVILSREKTPHRVRGFTGGGGRSRTAVQESVQRASTCVSRCLIVGMQATSRRVSYNRIPIKFRLPL